MKSTSLSSSSQKVSKSPPYYRLWNSIYSQKLFLLTIIQQQLAWLFTIVQRLKGRNQELPKVSVWKWNAEKGHLNSHFRAKRIPICLVPIPFPRSPVTEMNSYHLMMRLNAHRSELEAKRPVLFRFDGYIKFISLYRTKRRAFVPFVLCWIMKF